MSEIVPIKMPKWGLAMAEGTIVEWHKAEGDQLSEGDDLVDIETAKITNICEAPQGGNFRRIVAKPGDTLPVGALIGVIADASVSDAEVDAFIEEFNANFVPEAADGEDAGQTIREIEAAGRKLRVGEAGLDQEGVPAVLIHGFGGDLNNWPLTIDALAAQRPIYSIELPGHGESSKDVGDGDLDTMVECVLGALDALKIGKAHLIGHSMGGAVALGAALARPQVAASLALICPAAMPGGSINREYLDGFIKARRARDLKPVVEMLFADPALATKALLEDLIKFKRLDGVADALGKIRDRLADPQSGFGRLGQRLGEAGGPFLMIASRQDRIVGAPDPAALPGGVTLEWVDEAGHMAHLEAASRINELLARHLGG